MVHTEEKDKRSEEEAGVGEPDDDGRWRGGSSTFSQRVDEAEIVRARQAKVAHP